MKSLLLILSFLIPLLLTGQQLPFQGKLSENGQVVTGQRTFVFTINSGGINWTETHPNEQVTNGLYALILGQNTPLPTNLFDQQIALPMAVEVNGQVVSTVNLYPPIESDPTVPAFLKDGVSWAEVSNKPTLDESSTNELQQLSVNGNDLSITNGNTVALPSGQNPALLEVGENLTQDETALEQLVQTGTLSTNTAWQSFNLLKGGKLKAVEVEFANSISVDVEFRLYPGTGTGSQAIWSRNFSAADYGPTLGLQSFPVSDFIDINLEAGENYTLHVAGTGNDLLFRIAANDPYPFGTTNIAPTTDLVFKIILETESGYLLEVKQDLTSVNTPFVVHDRIEDKTGFVMPVGIIAPYGGSAPPKGWLLCDGSTVRRDAYSDLFTAIGTAWGQGDGSTTFHLPDLRGQFLRGVSSGTNTDPDANSRTASNGGNSGNNVGSYQADEFKSHNHPPPNGSTGYWSNTNIGPTNDLLGDNNKARPLSSTGNSGGSETRPRNAYVNFIIKY